MLTRRISFGITYLLSAVVLAVYLVPIAVILVTSLKSPTEATQFNLNLPSE